MPFTLVHPAAVVPLARSPLVTSALVAGAVAPDVTYYVPLTWIDGDLNLTLTHSVTSVLWLDPLIALVLLVAFHALLKRPLVALLPEPTARRVAPYVDRLRWRRPADLAWIAVSLAVGAATHLAWDALGDVAGYDRSTALNLVGDLVGAAVLVWWLDRWWRAAPPGDVPAGALTRWARTLVVTVVGVVSVAWVLVHGVVEARELAEEMRQYGGLTRGDLAQHVVRQAAIDGATALALLVGAYAVGWHAWSGRRRARA